MSVFRVLEWVGYIAMMLVAIILFLSWKDYQN